jgi:light-regulated signal transduction histidine kinase (bacteriophytochrome)/anti-sigma regulatory factor (Ser/Thr protein kinase)
LAGRANGLHWHGKKPPGVRRKNRHRPACTAGREDFLEQQNPAIDVADLTACDREPIHIPGSIQPHAALLALDQFGWRIVHAGGDTACLLGAPPADLLGGAVDRVLRADHVGHLRALLHPGQLHNRPMFAFSMTDPGGTVPVDVIVHLSTGLIVLEFERRPDRGQDNPLALVQTMVRHVQRAESIQAFCDAIAREVRAVTGFDRVMIYRFLEDGSGAVVAEARDRGAESFLGLHYPESDIPKQARALYQANWLRMIPDARYSPAPLLPEVNPANGFPLDLSQAVTRSVAAVHRQYLANMGVVASMSLSLLVRGNLWGMVACHHPAPRYIRYQLREACELFAEMISSQLEMKLAADLSNARLQKTQVLEELVRRMSQAPDIAEGLTNARPNLQDFVPAPGVGLWIDGRFTGVGETPAAADIETLVVWLNATVHEGVFHTDCLSMLYPPAAGYADVASGLLALSISRTPRDYLMWFRPEVIKTVTWAGNPDKPVTQGAAPGTLTPRQSFAAWQQQVKLRSAPWVDTEIEAAHRLRLSLLEVVLRRIDQLAREREAARAKQAQLTAELDRRLDQWQSVAQALQRETERRAVVEAELSQVLRHTVADQEAERQRISRELHDTLGQSLTLLQLGLEGIGRAAPGNDDVQQRLDSMKHLAADVGREVNRLAWEIRPTLLDDLGIQNAVRNLLETWSQRTGILFDLEMRCDDRRLPTDIETALYRVLQEALTNVVRHAEATHVGVILGVAERRVIMIVEDDGHGFEVSDGNAESPSRRLGLLGIRERLSLVGGTLEIESSPGAGTTLFIRIPV